MLLHSWNFSASTGVGCHFLLQRIIPIQGLNPGLLNCRQMLQVLACSNSCLLSQWCHTTIWSSVIPFSSCLQSFPASVSFPMSQFFASGGQNIGVSGSVSVLPMNIQDWFPLQLTGLISLQSKWLSRVFSSTTVWKHQFLGAQPSLRPNSHIHSALAWFNC